MTYDDEIVSEVVKDVDELPADDDVGDVLNVLTFELEVGVGAKLGLGYGLI